MYLNSVPSWLNKSKVLARKLETYLVAGSLTLDVSHQLLSRTSGNKRR